MKLFAPGEPSTAGHPRLPSSCTPPRQVDHRPRELAPRPPAIAYGCGSASPSRASLLVAALMVARARCLWHSTTLTVLAGGLLAIDGNAIVHEPRPPLLDGILTLVVATWP